MASRRRPQSPQPGEWNFRTFPVYFAFAAGMFVAVLLAPYLYGILFVLSLFGLSFGVAHMISHTFRKRSRAQAQARADEEERERRALAARAARAQEAAGQEPGRRRRRRRT
jgi:hypothetical protein